jgi:hypothetical protein
VSYLLKSRIKTIEVMIGSLSHATSLSTGDYMTFAFAYDDIGITGGGTDTLTLSDGHYAASAVLGASATNASTDEVGYVFELDGSTIGAFGGRQAIGKVGSDAADCIFTVQSGSTSNLKLKISSVTGTVTTLTSHSQIFLRRVDL